MIAHYKATWPIIDQERRLGDLTAEAFEDLADMLDREGLVMDRAPSWRVRAGDEPTLEAICPVRVPADATDRFALVTEYRIAGVSAERIAADLGITARSLYRWAMRHHHHELAEWINADANIASARYREGRKDTCRDCGKLISRGSTRCDPCSRHEVAVRYTREVPTKTEHEGRAA